MLVNLIAEPGFRVGFILSSGTERGDDETPLACAFDAKGAVFYQKSVGVIDVMIVKSEVEYRP